MQVLQWYKPDTALPSNLTSSTPGRYDARHNRVLSRTLSPRHANYMVFSFVVGTALLSNTTYALDVAGIGAILALAVLTAVVACVTVSIAEMTSIFPIANAAAELVHHFVDRDLAQAIGPMQWYSYSVLFTTLVASAINLLRYSWDLRPSTSIGVAIAVFAVLVTSNLLPVRTLGHVTEGLAILKVFIILTALILTSTAVPTASNRNPAKSLSFGSNGVTTASNGQAVCVAISLAVFSFVGMESIGVAAAETMDARKSTRRLPWVFWMVASAGIWMLVVTFSALGRGNSQTTSYSDQGLGGFLPYPDRNSTTVSNIAAPLEVLQSAGLNRKAIEVLLVISILSAANTALYMASRVLFGTVLFVESNEGYRGLITKSIGRVSPSGIPQAAVLVSALSYFWLLLLVLGQPESDSTFQLMQVMTSIAIVFIVMLWGVQCLSYIRFRRWRASSSAYLTDKTRKIVTVRKQTGWFCVLPQPYFAYVGLTGCIAIIVIFNSATCWSENGTYLTNFLGAYLGPLLVTGAWLAVKTAKVLGELYRTFRQTTEERASRFSWTDTRHRILGLLYQRLDDPAAFEATSLALGSRIYPTDFPLQRHATEEVAQLGGNTYTRIRGSKIPHDQSAHTHPGSPPHDVLSTSSVDMTYTASQVQRHDIVPDPMHPRGLYDDHQFGFTYYKPTRTDSDPADDSSIYDSIKVVAPAHTEPPSSLSGVAELVTPRNSRLSDWLSAADKARLKESSTEEQEREKQEKGAEKISKKVEFSATEKEGKEERKEAVAERPTDQKKMFHELE